MTSAGNNFNDFPENKLSNLYNSPPEKVSSPNLFPAASCFHRNGVDAAYKK